MQSRAEKRVCVTCSCRFEAIRSIHRLAYGKHGNTNVLLLPTGLSRVLSRVVDSDLDTDNRALAMACLCNIASKTHGHSLVLVDNEIIACALRVVQEQGTGAAPFSPPTPPPPPLAFSRTLLLIFRPAFVFSLFALLSYRNDVLVHQRKVWIHADERSGRFLEKCIRISRWCMHAAAHGRAYRAPAHLFSAR